MPDFAALKKHGVQVYGASTTPWEKPCTACGAQRSTVQMIAETQAAERALRSVFPGGQFGRGGQGGLVAYLCSEFVHDTIVDVALIEALRVEALMLAADDED